MPLAASTSYAVLDAFWTIFENALSGRPDELPLRLAGLQAAPGSQVAYERRRGRSGGDCVRSACRITR
jgi:hypothetical protein